MDLDPLFLSRLQWAWVIAWHILLPAFTVHDPRLEIDHDSVQVFDFVDHFVGGSAELPKPALLTQSAMAATLELGLREFSRFPHCFVHGRSRNRAVVENCMFRIELVDEPQSPDVLDPIEDDAKHRSKGLAIEGDQSNFVFGGC